MAPSLILLPQMSGNGYYSYSPLGQQYGTQPTVDTIVRICRDWFRNQGCLVGIGDMSFPDGHRMAPHNSHKDGKCIDIRPLHKNRISGPVSIHSATYDQISTDLLVRALLAHSNVSKILFNDNKIHGVRHWPGHDNHMHVLMKR